VTTLAVPFSPLFKLSRDIDRESGRSRSFGGYFPAADVLVSDEGVTVAMDVPGVQVGDLEIELENHVLTVRGERSYPYATGGETRAWQQVERGFGKFERSLELPHGLDAKAIEASLDAGVLALRIPKPEALKPRRVEIDAGKREEARRLEGVSA
jgi:HSP20 family protein